MKPIKITIMKTREKIFAVGLLMLFASLNINAQEVEKRICSDKYSVTIEEAMVQDGAVILDMVNGEHTPENPHLIQDIMMCSGDAFFQRAKS